MSYDTNSKKGLTSVVTAPMLLAVLLSIKEDGLDETIDILKEHLKTIKGE